jgi:hypothetical protein
MQRAASVPRKKMILNQTHRLLPVRQSSRERATSSTGTATPLALAKWAVDPDADKRSGRR